MKKFQQKLEEMASIGKIKGLEIQVYTDHNPPHFHVVKKDEYEIKISIKGLKILKYSWQKDNKKISSKELKALENWLTKDNTKNKKMTNKEAIQFAWKILN